MDERRTIRVSEAVREELAEIIGFELDDPRLLGVDVTEVHVSPDARYAHVTVVVRHELAARLSLRRVPELHFEPDKNPDADTRIEFLLKRAKKSRSHAEN